MLTLPDFKEQKIAIVFTRDGEKISFSNDNLVIKDDKNKIKYQYTCYKMHMLIIVGGLTITTGVLERAKKFNFSIILMTTNLKVYQTINNCLEGNTLLRNKQYNNLKEMCIAREIIKCKINSQRNILNKIRNKNEDLKETINLLDNYIVKINTSNYNNYELMGIEGIAAKIFFKEIYKEYNWNGRQPRLKRDYINLLLDIGYTMLFNFIESILNIYGFDIYKGILHQEFYKRKSLVCDMIEPFRPIIDYKIRKMLNLSQIDENDFTICNDRFTIKYELNKKYIKLFMEEIILYKIDIFEFIQRYYRWFMKDTEMENFPQLKIGE